MAALVSTLVLLVIACGGDADSGATQLPTSSPIPATVSPVSAFCDPARPHEPGTSYETITSGGQEWEYRLDVPPSYTGEEAVPLVLNFHGLDSSIHEAASAERGLPAKGAEAGFILVTPQGHVLPAHYNVRLRGWDLSVSGLEEQLYSGSQRVTPLYDPGHENDSVAFVDDLLDHLEVSLCIDKARVYSSGSSMGAGFSIILACVRSDRIAAIAPVAQTFFCRTERPVPMISFHGSLDDVVPYEGGPLIGIAHDLWPDALYLPVEEAVAAWGDHNGCASPPRRESVRENVVRISYEGCAHGATVELYNVLDGGHAWPTADDAGIVATDLIWDFFLAHPMP
jgi:polyhydroxybutyrate depolymerase